MNTIYIEIGNYELEVKGSAIPVLVHRGDYYTRDQYELYWEYEPDVTKAWYKGIEILVSKVPNKIIKEVLYNAKENDNLIDY